MARHRHLVKAAADPDPEGLPALPDAPDFGDPSDDVYQPEEQPEDVLANPPDARDISAELSAPPRRKLPWPTLLLTSAVVAVLAFTGGVLVEKGQSSGSATPGGAAAGGARFGAAASAGTGGQAPGGGNASGAGSGMTAGTVKVVDGSTIYVTDAQGNIIKVKTGKSTQVSVAKSGKVSDLKPGQTVTVRGSQSSSGDITATTVTEGGTVGGFGGRGGQPSSSSGG
ncbi:MAG: hypothetical protein QOF84_182 [Streptomyces sp.]|jgi:hypothetical protein|nr:hypothetical protein [Streptomyces sp.]MDX6345392.1 hypothetical protein [Streptomyces sp.]